MKKILCLVAGVVLILSLACSCSSDKAADMVVYGTVYTAEDDNDGMAEAFAVKDGKYVYVGDKKGAESLSKEGKTKVIDNTGKGLVIPGCTEGHSHHFGFYGVSSQLPGYKYSYEELLEILKKRVKEEKGELKQFVSFGCNNQELIVNNMFKRNYAREIEKIAPGVPVVMIDNAGHAAICSVTALKKAGLWKNPEVRGGDVIVDKKGTPTGFVDDQALPYVLEHAIERPLSEKGYDKACAKAVEKLHREGYTNNMDAWINFLDDSEMIKAIHRADEAGKLNMNVVSCYNIKSYDADEYKEKTNHAVKLADENESEHYDPHYIKLFADGVVESSTGWVLGKYNGVEKGKEHGNIVWKPKELKKVVEYANSKDILIHTHAYGDAACRAALDAYIASNKANGAEFRNCLGHVRNITDEDIKRAADNNIPIAENLIWHAGMDNDIFGNIARKGLSARLPKGLYESGYPMKSLLDNGVVMSSSTDAPAAESVEGNIMNVIEIAVSGRDSKNAKIFGKDELLTVKEALKALTINGAWQLGLEDERGSITEGKYADFVMLDKNILDYKKEELCEISEAKVSNTYFEGECVYTAEQE